MKFLIKNIIIIPIIICILSLTSIIIIEIYGVGQAQISYVEFNDAISKNNVKEVYITNSNKITVKENNGAVYLTDNPNTPDFKVSLLSKNIKVFNGPFLSIIDLLPKILLILSIAFIAFILSKKISLSSKGLVSVEKLDSIENINNPFNFNNVAGNEEAKESVKDIVDFLKNPEKYKNYGARIPKGIILYGEPGTGKTLLAKAVAGEAGVPFYAVSGSDFVQVYVGVGASRIRQLFKKAKANQKAVIFIDEIDAIGKMRSDSNGGGGDSERDQTLNALLTEMSGFNDSDGIVVMAATNRLDILDAALLRPGRFDRHVEISLPDINAREKILKLHLTNKPVGNIKLESWANKTSYFSGAKLESLVNEAAIFACKNNSSHIEDIHLDYAYSSILAGFEKINRDYIKENDKKVTAFHEIGHALLTNLLLPQDTLSKVSIIPTTKGAGGYTLSIQNDIMYQSKEYLTKRIMVLLGGRAAEEIILGKDNITTGASNDLKVATEIIVKMNSIYGMGESLGLLSHNGLPKEYFSSKSSSIVEECKNTIDTLYEDTKAILIKNSKKLYLLADTLILKEVLFEDDIKKILEDCRN